jgi:hypothetical protein
MFSNALLLWKFRRNRVELANKAWRSKGKKLECQDCIICERGKEPGLIYAGSLFCAWNSSASHGRGNCLEKAHSIAKSRVAHAKRWVDTGEI